MDQIKSRKRSRFHDPDVKNFTQVVMTETTEKTTTTLPTLSGWEEVNNPITLEEGEEHTTIEEGEENGVIQKVELGNGIPFRSLSYPPINNTAPRKDPSFYSGGYELPVITQEQILRDSGFPRSNKFPDNFWGLKPPK